MLMVTQKHKTYSESFVKISIQLLFFIKLKLSAIKQYYVYQYASCDEV